MQESLVVDKIILSDSHFYATWSLFFCNLKWNAKLCMEVLQLRKIILSDSQTSNQIWTFLQFDHKLTWSTCCRRDSAKLFKRKSVGLLTGSSLIDEIISRVWSYLRKILSEKTAYFMLVLMLFMCRQLCVIVQDRMCSTVYEPRCSQGTEKR